MCFPVQGLYCPACEKYCCFAIPYLPEEDEALDESSAVVQETQIDLDPDLPTSRCVQGGRPLGVGASPSTSSSSVGHRASDTDTDVDELFDAKMSGLVLLRSPDKAKARVCPICGTELFSGLVLINHMKITHPDVWLYKCEKCASNFNNLWALSCYISVVHGQKKVACKMCDYKMLTRAQMWQHVHVHSKGFTCSKCHHSFSNVTQFKLYQKTHGYRMWLDCKHCDAFYFSLKFAEASCERQIWGGVPLCSMWIALWYSKPMSASCLEKSLICIV